MEETKKPRIISGAQFYCSICLRFPFIEIIEVKGIDKIVKGGHLFLHVLVGDAAFFAHSLFSFIKDRFAGLPVEQNASLVEY